MNEVGKSTEPERELFGSLLLYGGLAVTGLLLSQFAFTRKVREQILERDGHRCVEEGNGICVGGLEVSHLNHDRDNPDYNSPETGITLCTLHHLAMHLAHRRNPSVIGLSKNHNDFAIRSLKERLENYKARYSGR